MKLFRVVGVLMVLVNVLKGLRFEKLVYVGLSDLLKLNMGVVIDRIGGCGDVGLVLVLVVVGVFLFFIYLSCFEYLGYWMLSFLYCE